MSELLLVEDVIVRADLLPPRPAAADLARLGTVDRLTVTHTTAARNALRQDVLDAPDPLLRHRYVDDSRCGQSFTVMGYIAHTAQVQHEAGEVLPQAAEVDERDAGRQGESRTAARS